MSGYTAPRLGGPHQPRRTPMRVADGFAPSVTGGGPPSVPRRRRVIPQPFERPSTELVIPGEPRREWRYVEVEQVRLGDVVPDVGVVVEVRGDARIGCTYYESTLDRPKLCWLDGGHAGDHETSRKRAVETGRVMNPGVWTTLVGPEVEREFPPHAEVRAFQLEE